MSLSHPFLVGHFSFVSSGVCDCMVHVPHDDRQLSLLLTHYCGYHKGDLERLQPVPYSL